MEELKSQLALIACSSNVIMSGLGKVKMSGFG